MRLTSVLAAVIPLGLALSAAVPTHAQTLSPAGEGRRLYLQYNCYSCHGMYGAGAMGPNIRGQEAGDVKEAVTHGEETGMRAFNTYLTATDISNLTAYIRSMGTPNEPKFNDWWVPNPPK